MILEVYFIIGMIDYNWIIELGCLYLKLDYMILYYITLEKLDVRII